MRIYGIRRSQQCLECRLKIFEYWENIILYIILYIMYVIKTNCSPEISMTFLNLVLLTTGEVTSKTPDPKLQRFAHIKSSGYGVSSPARSNQARVTWSMSEAAKQKQKGQSKWFTDVNYFILEWTKLVWTPALALFL